jgi:alpha-L-fucosidase
VRGMRQKWILLVVFGALWLAVLSGAAQKYYPETDPAVLNKLEQWRDLKFGLLMHWGPYSQWGVVESWSICPEDEPWCRRKGDNYDVYRQDYEHLKTTFNPVRFDPARWAAAARSAGMKYMVFTTKHHDGFCMFDTGTTEYKITDPGCPFSSNPKANITKEIFDAFRREGFWTGAYFSKPDWHNPDYWWPYFPPADRNVNYSVTKYPERWERFVQSTHTQIDELMTDYGQVDILWLDGGWVRPYTPEEILAYKNRPGFKQPNLQNQDIRMGEIVRKARAKQPGLIVVDRAVEGPYQNYVTPENRIPGNPISEPWESNIISGGGYSYTFDADYMSGREVVKILVDIVAKGGNLLLNIAPSPLGEFDEGAYRMLEEVGAWMAVNSECIYDTRAVDPYLENQRLYFTKNPANENLYAIFLAAPEEKTIPPEIFIRSFGPKTGMTVSLLGGQSALRWQKVGLGFKILIPEETAANPPHPFGWVFKISRR